MLVHYIVCGWKIIFKKLYVNIYRENRSRSGKKKSWAYGLKAEIQPQHVQTGKVQESCKPTPLITQYTQMGRPMMLLKRRKQKGKVSKRAKEMAVTMIPSQRANGQED